MDSNEIDIARLDTGEFLVRIDDDGSSQELVLALMDAEDASGGLLRDDESTARATALYLLDRQGPGDLPERLDMTDIIAAYDGAADEIHGAESQNSAGS